MSFLETAWTTIGVLWGSFWVIFAFACLVWFYWELFCFIVKHPLTLLVVLAGVWWLITPLPGVVNLFLFFGVLVLRQMWENWHSSKHRLEDEEDPYRLN